MPVSRLHQRNSPPFSQSKYSCYSAVLLLAALLAPVAPARAQSISPSDPQTTRPDPTAGSHSASDCPVTFLKFNPDGVSTRVENVSNKKIVGLIFNVALADATEHWAWIHWDYDLGRPVMNFSWNKPIKPGQRKRLSWYLRSVDHEHGGGGAFVLTSVLYEDGSRWEEEGDEATCKYVWANNNKKVLLKPVALPFR